MNIASLMVLFTTVEGRLSDCEHVQRVATGMYFIDPPLKVNAHRVGELHLLAAQLRQQRAAGIVYTP